MESLPDTAAQNPTPRLSGWLWRPALIVFLSSACIMVLELVAGRIIAPHVGVSLYTWTSVIGVVLAGISLVPAAWWLGDVALLVFGSPLAAALEAAELVKVGLPAGEATSRNGCRNDVLYGKVQRPSRRRMVRCLLLHPRYAGGGD